MADDLSMFGVSNAPAATPTAKTSGDDLSMFGITKPAPTTPAGAALGDNPWSDLKSVGQAGAALVTGAAAPISATVDRAAQYVTSKIPGSANYGKPVTPYSQDKAELTYTPTDPNAQSIVQGVGTVLKPVGDTLHLTAKVLLNDLYGDNDPEHINMASDALAYAVPGLKSSVKVGDAAAEEIASQAPSLANHPAVQAANDLAGKYDVQLTKGQQVAQAATNLPASQTATAKALNLPYQTEARLADQGSTSVGKALDNHFDTQQNILAGHVQDVADSLRKVGEDDAADAVEGTINQASPGVNFVSGPKLQRVVNKDLIQDPALSAKLDDLNNLHDIIEQPDLGPITKPSGIGALVSHITGDKPIPAAIGSAIGGVAGFKAGALLGHPFMGADAGAALGAAAGGRVANLLGGLRSGSVDLGTVTDADLAPAANELGLSTADLKTELSKPQNAQAVAPAAPAPAPMSGVSPSPQPMPARTMPTVNMPPAAQALGPSTPKPTVTAPAAPSVAPAPVISTPTQAAQAASENLYNQLKNNKLQVTFNKVGDKSERVMNATLKDEHLPEGYTSDTPKYPQLTPGKPLTVWDLDKQGWRSFHPSTVTAIKAIQ